ncbi:MAG TPA: ATP-binding protein, partial [Anaerolineales bacterium]|nr:ATP-binding protein [Anaerolineales bacterium]
LIEREALRIKRIVTDLLGVARQSTAEVTRNDLREILDKALGLVEYQLTNENIRITRAHAGEPGWVMVDRDQILQVVINLIQNARQAMPEGGGLIVRTWSQKQDSLFSITDTGLGIPEADLDRIFDPFFTTKPVGQGTGLGLSVSYGIIRRHGGDIRVASQPGAGTTFIVRLPGAVKLVQEPDAK